MVTTIPSNASTLPEQLIQDSFHSYLKSSLSQAKAEKLLDEDLLSSAEADLMVTGPALCLLFAALRSTTNPPSVPLPSINSASTTTQKNRTLPEQPTELSYENCPPAFASFLRVWAKNVPLIQVLAPEYQHDVARAICGLQPLCHPIDVTIDGVAADLRGVAIEISQRRSFQDRYASALQAALDSGEPGGVNKNADGSGSSSSRRASFVPPPLYQLSPPSPKTATHLGSDRGGRPSLESRPPVLPPRHQADHQYHRSEGSGSSYFSSSPHPRSPSTSTLPSPSPTAPSLLSFDSPAIEFIRETLYASLADQLERFPSLRAQLKTDPTRAYYASVSFAILDVAMTSIAGEGEVVGVLGKRLTLAECPSPLRPFMNELIAIGREARDVEEQDTKLVVSMLESGQDFDDIPPPRLERVKRMLEFGIGVERGRNEGRMRSRSVQGRAVAFTNRISALALRLTALKAFRERQEYVFRVLESIGT